MANGFQARVAVCRDTYGVYQQLAARTDHALYQALGEVHSLCRQIRTDPSLETAWRQLLQQTVGDKLVNETLFLVKYAYFPGTLQPGPGHKTEITKASRYAKLINRALDQGIAPADFVAFAGDQGIQRTAASSGSGPSRAPGSGRPHRRSRRTAAPRNVRSPLLAAVLRPLTGWFYSDDLAARFAACVQAAQDQPQKLSLIVYIDHERAVLTGVTRRPVHGEFPAGAVRIENVEPAQPPPAPARKLLVKPAPAFATRPPVAPTRLSARTPLPARRPRPRSGLVWPSWRSL